MKALFREIRAGDVAGVAQRLDANPDLVHAVATAPPKKDGGQSTLQVAIKSGQFEVAHLLISRGADVNFIDRSMINGWNTPVLHDAIRAAVFSSRFGRNRALPSEPPQIEITNTLEQFARAFGLLAAVIARGASVTAQDSAGNPALLRAVLDTRQVVDGQISADLAADLHAVFDVLLGAGADSSWVDPRLGSTIADFAGERIRPFLRLA